MPVIKILPHHEYCPEGAEISAPAGTSICEALLGNGGRYKPFLDLALASEGDDGQNIATQAGMLGLTASQFNRAQLQALSFADAMEF